MNSVLNAFAFLEHTFSVTEQNDLYSFNGDYVHEEFQIPYHSISVTRNVVNGDLECPDVGCKRMHVGLNYFDHEDNPTKRETKILAELKALCNFTNNETGVFSLDSMVLSQTDTSAINCNDFSSISNFICSSVPDKILHEWIYPQGLSSDFIPVLTSPSSSGSYMNLEARNLLMRRIRTTKPCKRYAIEEEFKSLPALEELIKDPAFRWNFQLDWFQKQAILCLERNQPVFVAAHTSAGKTVVAEYACAMCRRRGSRVIYTSPIKALSNQKFYDFRRTFGEDVGLLTGDVKVAPESTFLIMTTEILHNMLCSSADTIRDLEVVIMDEVHYVNDPERGHVWEQIMIMLPKHVLLVMLSATVPNTLDFADWLGRIRGTEIHVVTTTTRPVPLKHFLFTGLDGQNITNHLHLVVDEHNKFNESGYKRACLVLLNGLPNIGHMFGFRRGMRGRTETVDAHQKRLKTLWLGVVRLLTEQELMPAIAFGFSRPTLEMLAACLGSVDLLNASEKMEVKLFIKHAIRKNLKSRDQKLNSVRFITNLVQRGLAVHHAGMLPLLKETVEMLFQRGLVRLLFATETFALGVNMPARCVIFTSLEKYDGKSRRPLNPGEYTQMAGRAGRRGLDTAGYVIILNYTVGRTVSSGDIVSSSALSNVILGKPTQLVSKFKITYSMILHLHRSNSLSPPDVMRRSFMEAAGLRQELELKNAVAALRAKVLATTTSIASAGSAGLSGQVIRSDGHKTFLTTPLSVSFGEPVLQVKCPFGGLVCVDSMATYYTACQNYRQLTESLVDFLGELNIPDLQKAFSCGRLVFVQLPPTFAQDSSNVTGLQPNWIVPAMIVEITRKVTRRNKKDLSWNLITWRPPSYPEVHQMHFSFDSQLTSKSNIPTESTTLINKPVEQSGIGDGSLTDADEEEILKRDEDPLLSPVPFPPQLMPVYIPPSLEDGFSRLTLLTGESARSLVRVCDQVLSFKSQSNTSGLSAAELVTVSMTQYEQEQTAAKEGVRLVQRSSMKADVDWATLLNLVNTGLYELANSLISGPTNGITPSLYGLPADKPASVKLDKFFKGSMAGDVTLFDELSLLAEELTSPLLGSPVKQRLAPITCPDLIAHLSLVHRTCRRRWAIKRIENNLSDTKLMLHTEYTGRLQVLQDLGFIEAATDRACLSMKGRVACELRQMEVLLTEILLNGLFTELSAPDIAAVMSTFVFEIRTCDVGPANQTQPNEVEKSQKALHESPEHLREVLVKMNNAALKLRQLQVKYNLYDPDQNTRLNFQMVRAVLGWATGNSFSSVTRLISIPEGQFIRGLSQLSEMLRHVCNACHLLGDEALRLRVEEAKTLIHRDIACLPSLYISEEV